MLATIYYDGDCPFCSSYVRFLNLRDNVDVRLVDLRSSGLLPEVKFLSSRFDFDKGMIVEIGGRLYGGGDAMHVLGLLSSKSATGKYLVPRLFAIRWLALALYPVLRIFRNVTLIFLDKDPLGKKRLSNLMTLFFICWGIFSYLHFLAYAYDYHVELAWTSLVIPCLGTCLIFYPRSRRIILALVLFMAWDAWQMMPILSNHTIIKNFFLLAVILGGLYGAIKAISWPEFFERVAPVGRSLLLVMYIFGVFHKINSGFLDSSVSCAVALWEVMPAPLSSLNASWVHVATIYGTLLVESLIFCLLVSVRFRHWGIVLGISFHSMLAFSDYALYTAFSMLSLSLHVLFLSERSATRILDSSPVRKIAKLARTLKGVALILALLVAALLYAHAGVFPVVSLVWCVFVLPFIWLVAKYGRDNDDSRTWSMFLSKWWALNIVSFLFFLNCLMPYFGLKTAQSVNMFANLRLEGGVSNHLVFQWRPGPFEYLNDLVSIESYSKSPYLNYIKANDLQVTYYDFLNRLERDRSVVVDYRKDGDSHRQQSAMTLESEIERVLHPRWFRKWFHFAPVDVSEPKKCALDR